MRWLDKWFKKAKPSDSPTINNDALLKAIDALARSDSSSNRATLYKVLLQSWLIIPTPEMPKRMEPGPKFMTATEATKIQVIGFTDSQQLRVTPAFTDEEALRNWDPNIPSVGLPARSFFQMIRELDFDDVIINPYDPIRKCCVLAAG